MTPIEVKDKIANSSMANWCNNISETIDFRYIDLKLTFSTVSSLYEFVDNQIIGWGKMKGKVPDEIYNSVNGFVQLKNYLIRFLNDCVGHNNEEIIMGKNDESIKAYWRDNIQTRTNDLSYTFTFDCHEIDLVCKLYSLNAEMALGAYRYFMRNLNDLQNVSFFSGAMEAHNLKFRENNFFEEQLVAEDSKLSHLKDRYQNILSSIDKHLIDHISQNNKTVKQLVDEVTTYKQKVETAAKRSFVEIKGKFESLFNENTQKQDDLIKLYEEKLRLEKPATYWKERAIKLNGQGWLTLKWLVALVIFACITLYFLLWQTPEGMLKSFFNEDKAIAIKWSIVYVSFISFIAFGIRSLSKVMFSSFHLARDAEEREQLSYVYLSLIQSKAIDKEDRTLIMQSLFSRADSGLLKEDSSPTMPGGIASKLVQ